MNYNIFGVKDDGIEYANFQKIKFSGKNLLFIFQPNSSHVSLFIVLHKHARNSFLKNITVIYL